MRTIRVPGHVACLATVALLFAIAPTAPLFASTVVSCPFSSGGDVISRGFYLESYTGSNLGTVTLAYTATVTGTYSVSVTAHRGAFDGPIVGTTRTATVNLTNGYFTPVTFDFGGAPVTPGNTLAFTQTGTGSGALYFDVGPCSFGSCSDCPGVVETQNTNPPLSTPLRNSVGIQVTANDLSSSCVPSDTVLCIDNNPGDRRFKITATFATSQAGGRSGDAQAIPLASLGVRQGGLFWFFQQSNPEMLVKVLNACTVNSKFWVFFSAGTNVGFRVTILDTVTGHEKIYVNPDLNPAPPLQDTSAFSCP